MMVMVNLFFYFRQDICRSPTKCDTLGVYFYLTAFKVNCICIFNQRKLKGCTVEVLYFAVLLGN